MKSFASGAAFHAGSSSTPSSVIGPVKRAACIIGMVSAAAGTVLESRVAVRWAPAGATAAQANRTATTREDGRMRGLKGAATRAWPLRGPSIFGFDTRVGESVGIFDLRP